MLSRTCSNIRNWCRSGVNNVESAIINLEADISNIESSDFTSAAHSLLLDKYAKLTALQRQSNIKWAQRARLSWIKNGDKNTSFFHTSTRIRAHFNYISQVLDANGNACRDQPSIEHVFLSFYRNLWSTSSTTSADSIATLPIDLPHLSESDAATLTWEVTKDEVFLTFLDLPPSKSPSPDGFNVEFYRNFWHIISDQFFSATRYFFDNSILPNSWGKTFVTLIPKKEKTQVGY